MNLLMIMVCLSPQTDVGALYSQLKELQKKNADMEERNKMLYSKVSFFPLQESRSRIFFFCINCIDCFFFCPWASASDK